MKATNKELGRATDFIFDTFLQGSDIEAGTPSANQERDADMESFFGNGCGNQERYGGHQRQASRTGGST